MPSFPGQRLLNNTAQVIRERAHQLQHLNRHDLMNEYTPAPLNKYWNAATVSCVTLILLLAPGLFVRVPLAALWVGLSFVLACIQGVYVVYQLVMIALSLALLILLRVAKNAYTLLTKLWYRQPKWRRRLEALQTADSWQEYERNASSIKEDEWTDDESDMPAAALLRRAIDDLAAARDASSRDGFRTLRFALSGCVKRNHLGIEDRQWYPARSPLRTKRLVDAYLDEVCSSLEKVAATQSVPVDEKARFFDQVRRTVGVTALCLSGGGAVTMYHGGHILGLIEAGLYEHVHVVSGTSGGAIMAAMYGCKTRKELLRDILVPHVSTDYKRDGIQGKEGLHFFPPLFRQLVTFASKRVLVDRDQFKRVCDFYWGTITFEEAYNRTKKVLCISVQAQRVLGAGSAQRLLMNHVTTPHVTLSSAVAASCALPGIMRPQRLEAKDDQGNVRPFEVDGVSWIDGSIQADVPFKRMATLFNVSNFVVAQVNFHVKPIVDDSARVEEHWAVPSLARHYERWTGAAELSVRMRATMLSQLGLMPTLYGNSVRKVFSQKYHGDVTVSPRFTFGESVGFKVICNPSVADMKHYLRGGKRALWPHVCRITRMVRLESCLADCWATLRAERRRSFGDLGALAPENNLPNSAIGRDVHGVGHDDGSPERRKVAFSTTEVHRDSPSYRQLEWEYRRLQTRLERLRSENLDLRGRLKSVAALCAVQPPQRPGTPASRTSPPTQISVDAATSASRICTKPQSPERPASPREIGC